MRKREDKMRVINTEIIAEKVCELFCRANYELPESIKNSIAEYKVKETDQRAKNILGKLQENMDAAIEINVPVCQDTGMAVVFIEIGQEVFLEGELLETAVNNGVRRAYDEGYLRKSVVCDPLFDRKNTTDNTPAVVYTNIVPGDKIRIVAAPKGFGSENMSKSKMFTPGAVKQDIIDFVVETVKQAGGNPCPPMVIGVGIGGTFEKCALLSKIALCRDLDVRNADERYAQLEMEMLEAVNKTGIGPQGFGGDCTALGVNIEYFPTHIAGLPCAVNIGCHVTRHKECVI